MWEKIVHEASICEEKEQSVDLMMIKDCPIIAQTYLINCHLLADKPPLSMYTHEVIEDKVMCFGKLR